MKKFLLFLFLILGGYLLWHFAGSGDEASTSAKPPTPVTVVSAYKERLFDDVEALGTAYANESVALTASVSEIISSINFADGQEVKKGSVIARLEQHEEEAQLRAAKAQLEEHRRELARIESLLANKAASQRDFDERQTRIKVAQQEIKGIEARLEDRTLRAPFDGVLGIRRVSVGALVQPGQVITTIDDIGTIKLDFSVPALYLAALKPGVGIQATTEALPGAPFSGEIETVDTRVDPVTRTVLVRAIIPNPEKTLRPGLLMHVSLMNNVREALVVSEEAVTQKQDSHYVWVVEPESSVAKQRKISVGVRRPGIVEVTSGLKEGELVVVRGVNRVQEGQKVSITEVWGQTRPPAAAEQAEGS